MAPPKRRQGAASKRDLYRIAVTALPLTGAQHKVAIALSEYMDYDTLEDARPGTAQLVERTQLAERTVKDALLFLRQTRVVLRTHKGGWAGGVFTASIYKGLMPPPGKPARTAAELRAQAASRMAAAQAGTADGVLQLNADERRARRKPNS